MLNPVQFYKCMADETRLKSLLLIQHENELCVCELTTALKEIQPKISRHLAQLRKCGLLVDRRQGQWVFYQISSDLPAWAQDVLRISCESNKAFLQEALENLRKMGDRPERAAQCC